MPQLTYGFDMPKSFAGMLADTNDKVVDSYGTAAAIPFGRGLVPGASEGLCALPSAAGQRFVGIALHEHLQPKEDGTAQHEIDSAVPVMTRGRVWVPVEQAVAPGDPVYVRHTNGAGGTDKGKFRKDADTATADQVANARWVKSGAAGGLAVLEINLP